MVSPFDSFHSLREFAEGSRIHFRFEEDLLGRVYVKAVKRQFEPDSSKPVIPKW